MPPKSSSNKDKDLTEEDEVLQAVILADSFNKRFKPLTVGKPRCLLPVCNATLLDWTFESLALAGVQEIFVICRSYAELVKAAIRDSKWSKSTSGIKIVPIITAKETYSPGDAMRDIYTRGIITSDFVLVMGDLVSNIRIDEVVREHKERRRVNKDAIMTMVVKESGGVHRTRSKGESSIFVLDAETSECLYYEPVTGHPPKKTARIPREILLEHPEVEIRNDLIDCSIDVCSVEVPSLFQDNFDYGDIRRDFVHGILTSDLLMKSIHCYVAKEGYAARVADTRSYDSVCKDILSRWTFPLVPDDNHPGGHSYEHLRGNKYLPCDNSVILSRTCKVGPSTLIGAQTRVDDNTTISLSVIGQRCVIGPNVILKNAYVFDDTFIGAGSVVEDSIIGSNVRVGEGSKVEKGCLVGDGVVLGPNAKLGKLCRVSKKRVVGEGEEGGDEEEEEDSELEDVEDDQEELAAILGEGSNAILWPKGPREDDEDLDEVERYDNQRLMRIGDSAADLDLEDLGATTEESDSEDSEDGYSDMHPLSRTSSATSASFNAGNNNAPPTPSEIHDLQAAAAVSEFQHEVRLSLERAFAENHSVDDASVELKTLRMASNVELRKVREEVVAAIVDKIAIVEGDAAGQRREIGVVVGRWGPLIDRIGGMDPVETIEVLQMHCAKSTRLPLFGQILAALYQEDIVDEDDIRAWHALPVANGKGIKDDALLEHVQRCWSVGSRMIQQFDEQESDSEEQSEEEEEHEPRPSQVPKHDTTSEEEEEEESDETETGSEDESEDENDLKTPVKEGKGSLPIASTSASSSTKTITPATAASESSEDDGQEDTDEDSEGEGSEDTIESIHPPLATSGIFVPPSSMQATTPSTSTSAKPVVPLVAVPTPTTPKLPSQPAQEQKVAASSESTDESEDDEGEDDDEDTESEASIEEVKTPILPAASIKVNTPSTSHIAKPNILPPSGAAISSSTKKAVAESVDSDEEGEEESEAESDAPSESHPPATGGSSKSPATQTSKPASQSLPPVVPLEKLTVSPLTKPASTAQPQPPAIKPEEHDTASESQESEVETEDDEEAEHPAAAPPQTQLVNPPPPATSKDKGKAPAPSQHSTAKPTAPAHVESSEEDSEDLSLDSDDFNSSETSMVVVSPVKAEFVSKAGTASTLAKTQLPSSTTLPQSPPLTTSLSSQSSIPTPTQEKAKSPISEVGKNLGTQVASGSSETIKPSGASVASSSVASASGGPKATTTSSLSGASASGSSSIGTGGGSSAGASGGSTGKWSFREQSQGEFGEDSEDGSDVSAETGSEVETETEDESE